MIVRLFSIRVEKGVWNGWGLENVMLVESRPFGGDETKIQIEKQ